MDPSARRHTDSALPADSPTGRALPVTLALGGAHADAVRRWVEGVLGWQAVDAETSRVLPPAVLIFDRPVPAGTISAGAPVLGGIPRVLLVEDTSPASSTGDLVVEAAPDAVVAWPSGRERLASVVADLVDRRRTSVTDIRTLRIGGTAGGVGTTTVALAVAGLWAWSGLDTLAVVRGTWPPLRTIDAGAISAPDVWARAEALAGVPNARALRVDGPPLVTRVSDPAVEGLVVDAGVDADVDVLVCRPDAAARAMVPVTTAGLVLVVGEGPVAGARLRQDAGGRRLLQLPDSARVARAVAQGRVPAALPGSWLRRLVPLADPGRPRHRVTDD